MALHPWPCSSLSVLCRGRAASSRTWTACRTSSGQHHRWQVAAQLGRDPRSTGREQPPPRRRVLLQGGPPPRTASAVEAYADGGLAFGFSAGGLLFPYYLGVVSELQDLGVLTPSTRVAGASAGSLIAGCWKSGLPMADISAACFELAADCRARGTRHRLRAALEPLLRQLLPEDAHEACAGGAFVAVTQVAPRVQGRLVSEFESRDDLIAALLTSCHIPWWFDGALLTPFRGVPHADGGLTNFIPCPPGASHPVRVACFPQQQLGSFGDLDIYPGLSSPGKAWPFSMQQMLGMAFWPASDERLRWLGERGRADAAAWAEAAGVAAAAAAAAKKRKPGGAAAGVSGGMSAVVLP